MLTESFHLLQCKPQYTFVQKLCCQTSALLWTKSATQVSKGAGHLFPSQLVTNMMRTYAPWWLSMSPSSPQIALQYTEAFLYIYILPLGQMAHYSQRDNSPNPRKLQLKLRQIYQNMTQKRGAITQRRTSRSNKCFFSTT